MSEKQDVLSELEYICQQQYEEIEKKKILIWDLEEEIRILQDRHDELQENVEKKQDRIDELEAWCEYLQKCLDQEKKRNFLFRIARKIKRIISPKND